jgi:hypothetical protein
MRQRYGELRPRRLVGLLLVLGAVVLVPWTLFLAYRLPSRHTSHHWDLAWVGFDVALAISLAVTGIGVARRATWAVAAATAAATLLVSDAWFDNALANGMHEHAEALLEAAFVEIPLAIICIWLALDFERVIAAVLGGATTARRETAPSRGARASGDGARPEPAAAPARRTRPG